MQQVRGRHGRSHSSFLRAFDAQPRQIGLAAVARASRSGCGDCRSKRLRVFRRHSPTAGLLHDLGKYTDEFQRRVTGDAIRVDHATRGAISAVERYGTLGHLVAYAIAGHHAGLANGSEGIERTALKERLLGTGLPALLAQWQTEIQLPALNELAAGANTA